MKKTIIIIGLLISGVFTSSFAQDTATRISELEAKVKILETQNLSLKAAIEKVSGKSLGELLAAEAPVTAAPVVNSAPPKDTDALRSRLADVQSRLSAMVEQVKAEEKAAKDPFVDREKGIKKSKADISKTQAIQTRAIAEMRAEVAALKAQIGE